MIKLTTLLLEREIKSPNQLKIGTVYFIHSHDGFSAKYIGYKNNKYLFKPINNKLNKFDYSDDEIYDVLDIGYIEKI